MMTAAERPGFSIDPVMLWVLLYVVSSDGLTVSGLAALATGSDVATALAASFAFLLVSSVAALWREVEREDG